MAKITGPLMSMTASGNLAGMMQFRANRYGAHVYRPQTPTAQNQQAPSPAQVSVRARYTRIRAAWNVMTEPQRQDWRDAAARDLEPITGWNLFFASYTAAPDRCGADGGDPGSVASCIIGGGGPADLSSDYYDGGTPWGTENTIGGRPYVDGGGPIRVLDGIRDGGFPNSHHVRIYEGGKP